MKSLQTGGRTNGWTKKDQESSRDFSSKEQKNGDGCVISADSYDAFSIFNFIHIMSLIQPDSI